ncbi:hypothetical protein CAPTEDRAFT_175968 [Capitella teleta]|uniref:Angiotensin-converting enzyme n=1 Tax=Capitella teleta TaxID=283909 RepID=R7V3M1_CAPTE|nr:hypothetical protein CAPTEDRAFT_175968 [Capitella teleta]|eukprot:ELU13139.1 hypothetical protein CAPTEDRAFT_175968 [Capitella teleta]
MVALGLFALALANEEEARQWAEEYNAEAQVVWYDNVVASWNYNTNLTDYNQDESLKYSAIKAAFDRESGLTASSYDYENFEDQLLARQFRKIADIGEAVLSEEDFNRQSELRAEMQRIYSTAEACNKPGDDDPDKCYPLDPDLEQIMATSTDWDELKWAWESWRDVSGRLMPDMYEEYAGLLNKAADMNGYDDNGDYWRSWYEMETFAEECERIWQQLRPLYEQLHAYVLRKLKEVHADHIDEFPFTGHIPAHLLGNMWSQSWGNIEEFVRPAPEKPGLDVTEEMIRQGYTPLKMFELSEEFFTSLGLIPMTEKFWDDTMMVKPDDRDVVCHASAWDFYNQEDFRIKQCTEVSMSWLITTHHEMGHVEYFLQYKDLPVQYRDGGNPGFHEAIGDVLALSVSTPEHLEEIGLLPDFEDDPDGDLNFLMNQALAKIAFIPFGYLIDQWRWNVFSGETQKEDYNTDWWEMRCRYQGVAPPVGRLATDFDAGAKYHVPANTPYIRYFISHILQFQFHKAMCDAAGNTNPLHRCDVYRSEEAGTAIGDLMKLGSSVHWEEALEAMTGTTEMSAEPLVEYFGPLLEWLEEQNAGETIGWSNECPEGTIVP